jgi:hypothetical protein
MQSQAVKEEEGHSYTSQKIRIFYIMLAGLWLVVFVCTVTCHIYILINQKPWSAGTLSIYQWLTTCTNYDTAYFSYCRMCVLQVRLVDREQAERDMQAPNLITETRILPQKIQHMVTQSLIQVAAHQLPVVTGCLSSHLPPEVLVSNLHSCHVHVTDCT